MMITEIRQQLHEYIDSADDKNVEALYTILIPGMQQTKVSADELKQFYDRRDKHLSGKVEAYSLDDAHAIVRTKPKKDEGFK